MRRTRAWTVAVVSSAAWLWGCAKPCDAITPSKTLEGMGAVLEGGRVCKEEKSVATIDYPTAKAEELPGKYTSTLGANGWKAESPADGTIIATKGDDTLFIVTGKKSKDRRVPFAVVRYCQDDGCRKQLTELASAMAKYK